MSTFVAEQPSVGAGYDISSDVERVVAASRHLHDFRTGYAVILERLACMATQFTLPGALESLEPALRILGSGEATRFGERLYRIASDVTHGWDPEIDSDKAAETLHAVVHDAVNKIMAELYADSCICRDSTKERAR